jgi:hypothetical protein
MRRYFGTDRELLFFCYEFMAELHDRPKSFVELFEFMHYCATKGKMKSLALEALEAKVDRG